MRPFARLALIVALMTGSAVFADTDDELLPSPAAPAATVTAEVALEYLRELAVSEEVQFADSCCKRCSKGKACGDSCIARDRTCRKGAGCACD